MAAGPHLRVHAIRIFVHNQERSVRFFVDQLGFNLAYDAKLQSGARWVAVAPPDGSTVLALISPKPGTKEHNLIGRSTGVVFVTESVPAKYQEWRGRGVRFQGTPRLQRVRYEHHAHASSEDESPVWGGVFARFEDPDRNSFTLIGFDEINREIEAQRQAAAQRQEAENRAAQELEFAKQVQARLFPQTLPAIKTLEYSGLCIQARQVGGDYYDFLDLGSKRFGLVVGDIAGKGMAAALLMANLQANLRGQCAISFNQPQKLLRSVNRLFFENSVETAYATLFFAEYEDETRRLRYVNCGHLPALLLRADGCIEKLDSTCTVLGLFQDWDCEIGERRLLCGDTLLLFTDGITESSNHAGEEFGERRLVEALHRYRRLSPPDLMSSIVQEVHNFSPHEQQDDITVIVGKCR